MYINIIFCKRRTWNPFSILISAILCSKYSHVVLEITQKDDRCFYHASFFGAVKINNLEVESNYKTVYKKHIELLDVSPVKTKAEQLLGRAYGFLGALGILIRKVFKLNTILGKDGEKTLICSEYVAICLKEQGLLKTDVDNIDPVELYSLVRSI